MPAREASSGLRVALHRWLGPSADRRSLVRVLAYTLATRLLLGLVLYYVMRVGGPRINPRARDEFGGASLLAGWLRWDTWWYLSIVESGYSYMPGYASNVAFLPGYPALVGLFHVVFHRAALAALVASNAAFLASVVVLWRWVRDRAGLPAAERSVLLLLVYPLSFYLNTAYAEAPFFLLCMLALWSIDRDRWHAAGVYAALATLTRPTGLFLAVAFGWEYFRRKGVDRAPRGAIVALCLPVAALGAYFGYLWLEYGTPFALFLSHGSGWGVGSSVKLFQLPHRNDLDAAVLDILNLVLPFVLAVFVARAWRRLGAVAGVYGALSAALGIVFGGESLGREVLAVVPVFAVSGIVPGRDGTRTAALSASFALLVVFVYGYSMGRFMG